MLNKDGKRWNKTATYIANWKFESLMTITIFEASFSKLVQGKLLQLGGMNKIHPYFTGNFLLVLFFMVEKLFTKSWII